MRVATIPIAKAWAQTIAHRRASRGLPNRANKRRAPPRRVLLRVRSSLHGGLGKGYPTQVRGRVVTKVRV